MEVPFSEVSRKAIIKLHYRCNNKCRFCRALPLAEIKAKLSTAEAAKKIVKARELGAQMVLFSGGEPTLRRDLGRLIAVTKRLGMEFGLVTNGRMLAYQGYFNGITRAGLKYVHTSLLGASSATHDDLTQVQGSFDDVILALKNIKSHGGIQLVVNTVITAQNIKELKAIADLLSDFAPLMYKLTLLEPTELDVQELNRLYVSPGEAATAAIDALNYAVSRYSQRGMKVGIEGFPLCLIRGYESFVENMMTTGILYISEVYERDFFPVDHGPRQYFKPCDTCSRRLECPGQYPGYGAKDLNPLNEPVPAAYPMTFVERQETEGKLTLNSGPACPAFVWSRSPDLSERNGVFLYSSRGLEYYRYDEGRPDGLVVQRLKEKGQVYLDLQDTRGSRKSSLLMPLALHPECRACKVSFACPTTYVEVATHGYERRLDQQIVRLLGNIGGRVADLGCARSYYTPVIVDLAKEGRISYIGVDPQGPVDLPEVDGYMIKILKRPPEEVEIPEKSLDWVVILDSINDFKNPGLVVERAFSWLVPGGGILVLDRAPFLLLGSQPREGWSIGKRKRNVELQEVARWLEDSGFVLEKVVPPSGGKTNIWYAVAHKPLN